MSPKSIMQMFIAVFTLVILHMQAKAQQSQSDITAHYKTSKPVSLAVPGYSGVKTRFTFTEDSIVVKDHNYYLQKSKAKRTAGWLFLGGGVIAIGAGLAIGANKNASFDDAATGGIIAAVGFLASLGSIPFFISASSNKRKARLLLNTQKTGYGIPKNSSQLVKGFTVAISI